MLKKIIKTISTVALSMSLSSAFAAPIFYLSGIGISGGATSHGDTLSSDTTFRKGPLSTTKIPQLKPLAAACPNIMMLSDGKVMATCVDFFSREPKLFLFDKDGHTLAQMKLSSSTLLGGVYAYANRDDEVLFVNKDNELLTIRAIEYRPKSWSLDIKSKISLNSAVTSSCQGLQKCDGVIAINPGSKEGDVWFVTQKSVVGVVNTQTKELTYMQLADNENVTNSFSTALDNVASIVTDKALYLLTKEKGRIKIKWRNTYGIGIGRKPGQLSWGSGATPSFFGPHTNDEYVTIVDNAFPLSNLLIYRAGTDKDSGKLVCKVPLFSPNNSGTEDSSIAYDRSVIVSSTYGYPYPKYPKNAGTSIPETAPFIGGMTRVDVNEQGNGCDIKWTNMVRSAALPKLSIADKRIYTIERTGPYQGASSLDTYKFINIDYETGEKLSSTFFGFGILSDPLQTAGNINEDGSYWQGIMNGIILMRP